MRKYHLFNMWSASTRIALCGRLLSDPWTVDHRGMWTNVCRSCQRAARLNGQNPRGYSPIEDRKGVAIITGHDEVSQ